jgi:hypothetical protein
MQISILEGQDKKLTGKDPARRKRKVTVAVAKTDYHQLGEEFKKLLKDEQNAQWEQGRFLYENDLSSDGQLQRFGQEVNRVPASLKKYREVYVQFRDRYPQGPPVELAWGVLKELTRVNDPDWRDRFLSEHPQAKRDAAEKAVNGWLISQRRSRSPRSKLSDYALVDNVKVDVTVRDGCRGEIVITGISDDGKVGSATLDDVTGDWRVSFTL